MACDLMQIVESRVKPEREKLGNDGDAKRRKAHWWLWGRYTPGLFDAVRGMERVLICGQASKYLSFVFLPNGLIYSHKTVAFSVSEYSWFAASQSRLHQEWADFFGSSMKDDPVYTPSDCFGTFPFPENFETDAKLEATGKKYYEFRAALMVKNNEGLTKTYNRFHDPNEGSADIQRLRELHAAMDRAVLDAYGLTDLKPTCEFLLDYEEDDEEDDTGHARKKKKPWRYRWPDEFRDEVLARLLELNKHRAEQERISGQTAEAPLKKAGKRTRKAPAADDKQIPLPGM